VKRAREKLLTLLEKKQAIYTSTLMDEKRTIVALKEKIEKKKLKLTKLVLQVDKEKKVARDRALALAKKISFEKEQQKIALAKKLAVEKEKQKIEEEKKIALAKKLALEEEKRVALVKKLAAEKEKQRLALLKKRELEEKKKRKKIYLAKAKEEVKELEKIDLYEGDQLSAETALFMENSLTDKSSNSGFKPLNKWINCSLGYGSTLNNLLEQDYGREALKTTCTLTPYSYYFAGTTLNLDLNDYENSFYQPDFSYSFGYSDWHQDTWSFGYSNYANNKINPREKENRFNFQSGTWEVGYKNKIDNISLTAKAKYVPITNDKKLIVSSKTTVLDKVMVSAQLQHDVNSEQNKLTLSAKTFIYDKLFVSGSVYEYYKSDTKGAMDPDYAYTIGWKDSRPFHPSITYSNYYMPTRWASDEGPKFKDGSLSVSFNLKF